MNENHALLCRSDEWTAHVQGEVLPFLVGHASLGEEMLEIGPGPGAATDWLRGEVKRLVALEVDGEAAARLTERFAASNVEVVVGDATMVPYPDESFDSVGSFTMLHHLETTEMQLRLLAEVLRVLRPGGVLIGSDSLASNGLHHFHIDDTYNPVEPASFLVRLQALGFERITISIDGNLRFVAHKPGGSDTGCAGDRCAGDRSPGAGDPE